MAQQQRVVTINGQTHRFPADATDAEIAEALGQQAQPPPGGRGGGAGPRGGGPGGGPGGGGGPAGGGPGRGQPPPSENPAMAAVSGYGAQPFGPNGLVATAGNVLNMAADTAQLPASQQGQRMTDIGGAATFEAIIAPLLKLTRPEHRAAVLKSLQRIAADPIGSSMTLGADPQTSLKAGEVLPVLGPGYTEANRRIATGDYEGGGAYAAGNTLSMFSPKLPLPAGVVNRATALTNKLTSKIPEILRPTGWANAMLHAGPGVDPAVANAATKTVLDEGFLIGGIKSGQRRAATRAGQVAEQAKTQTGYGATSGAGRNATFDEVAASRRATAEQAAADASEEAARTARRADETSMAGAEQEATRQGGATELLQSVLPGTTEELRGLGIMDRPPVANPGMRDPLPVADPTGPRPLHEMGSVWRPGEPPAPPPPPAPVARPPVGNPAQTGGVVDPLAAFYEPPPITPGLSEGAGGVRGRSFINPEGGSQVHAGAGVEGPSVQALFEPGRMPTAQQPFAHQAIMELLNDPNLAGGMSKEQAIDVMQGLRRERVVNPLEGESARTIGREAQAADISRSLQADTPAARDTLGRLDRINQAEQGLARAPVSGPLSFQLPWYARAGYALGAPATAAAYNVGVRLPRAVAPSMAEAFRLALLDKLAPKDDER